MEGEDETGTIGQLLDRDGYDAVVVYIDISGYRDILTKRGEKELFSCILKMVKHVDYLKLKLGEKCVQTKFLTDSALIYLRYDGDEESNVVLNSLICLLGYFQFNVMVDCNLMFRGGISIGRLYDNGFIFGDGYLKALRIENTRADYQRVVIEDEIFNRLIQPVRDIAIFECEDGFRMIDYLSCSIRIEKGEEPPKSEISDILQKHERMLSYLGHEAIKRQLDDLVDSIFEGVRPSYGILAEFQKVIDRYKHIVDYHLSVCRSYGVETTVTNPESDMRLLQTRSHVIEALNSYTGDERGLDDVLDEFKKEYDRTLKILEGR